MNDNKMNKEKDANRKETVADKAGNAIETVDDKLKQKGATKLGKKVHDLGDKIETHHTGTNRVPPTVEKTQAPDDTFAP